MDVNTLIIEPYLDEEIKTKIVCSCKESLISWNYNHTKWVCLFCGKKGTVQIGK